MKREEGSWRREGGERAEHDVSMHTVKLCFCEQAKKRGERARKRASKQSFQEREPVIGDAVRQRPGADKGCLHVRVGALHPSGRPMLSVSTECLPRDAQMLGIAPGNRAHVFPLCVPEEGSTCKRALSERQRTSSLRSPFFCGGDPPPPNWSEVP